MTDAIEQLTDLPAEMLALRFERNGTPAEALRVASVPLPRVGWGEVLVEVHAAGINPSDVRNVAGAFPQTRPPRIPGRDFAGRIVAGPASWLGAEVLGSSGELGFVRDGAHAQYVVARVEGVARKPAAMSWLAAASMGVPYVTAWDGLRRARFGAGESVLVIGGTGAVGRAVAQLARWSGASTVLATTREASRADDALRVHTDRVVDLSREDLVVVAREATAGRGVDVVFNAVGGETFAPGVLALARGGRLVVISAPWPDAEVRFDLRDFYRRELEFVGIDSIKIADADTARALAKMLAGVEAGALAVRAGEGVTLEGAIAAYDDVGRGAGRRTLVFRGP